MFISVNHTPLFNTHTCKNEHKQDYNKNNENKPKNPHNLGHTDEKPQACNEDKVNSTLLKEKEFLG